jgi:hypothetical protein
MPAQPQPRRIIPAKAVGEIFTALSKRQSNWLLCNGSTYDVATYPELAEVLTDYSELATGYLPDCRPRDNSGNLINASPGEFVTGYGTYVPTYIVVASVGNYIV